MLLWPKSAFAVHTGEIRYSEVSVEVVVCVELLSETCSGVEIGMLSASVDGNAPVGAKLTVTSRLAPIVHIGVG